MESPIDTAWQALGETLRACRDCKKQNLLHAAATPLLGRFKARSAGVLFVFEAPNLRDTLRIGDPYITYDVLEDETGKFTAKLFTEILGFDHDSFQVTNAALCLPRSLKGRYRVSGVQAVACSNHLLSQIEVLQPVVVASVGRVALDALRRIETFRYQKLEEVVGKPREWFGRHLFPLAHTSRLGRLSRAEQQQYADWQHLRDFIDSSEPQTTRPIA